MAFCQRCGAQMNEGATVCAACGQQTGAAAAPPYTPLPNTASAQGFLASLFDMSFTSFVTTKLIKVLYVLGILGAGLMALSIATSGFARGAGTGLLALIIVAPIVFFLCVIYSRVILELIIVVFRVAEHVAEIARQGRR